MIKPNFKMTVKPGKVNNAEIVIEPLPVNFGHTVGNALRRVLLSSLSGGAAVSVKIAGVTHQFSTLDNMQEDVLQFILNLKQVRFALDGEEETVKLSISGEKTVTAADLDLPSGVTVANPDQLLARLTANKSKLVAEIKVKKGVGYVPADENASSEAGVIPLDASFSPVIRVNYTVESTRVGRRTDLEKVRLNVTTNGTVDPETAVVEAAKILASFYTQVFNPTFEEELIEGGIISAKAGSDQSIEDLDLPTRITNALKKGGYKTLADLASASRDDLMKVKNLGSKSAELVIKKAKAKGIVIA